MSALRQFRFDGAICKLISNWRERKKKRKEWRPRKEWRSFIFVEYKTFLSIEITFFLSPKAEWLADWWILPRAFCHALVINRWPKPSHHHHPLPKPPISFTLLIMSIFPFGCRRGVGGRQRRLAVVTVASDLHMAPDANLYQLSIFCHFICIFRQKNLL